MHRRHLRADEVAQFACGRRIAGQVAAQRFVGQRVAPAGIGIGLEAACHRARGRVERAALLAQASAAAAAGIAGRVGLQQLPVGLDLRRVHRHHQRVLGDQLVQRHLARQLAHIGLHPVRLTKACRRRRQCGDHRHHHRRGVGHRRWLDVVDRAGDLDWRVVGHKRADVDLRAHQPAVGDLAGGPVVAHAEVLAARIGIGGGVPRIAGPAEGRAGRMRHGLVAVAVAALVGDAAARDARRAGEVHHRGHAVALGREVADQVAIGHAFDLDLEAAGLLAGVVDHVKIAQRAVDGGCLRLGGGQQPQQAGGRHHGKSGWPAAGVGQGGAHQGSPSAWARGNADRGPGRVRRRSACPTEPAGRRQIHRTPGFLARRPGQRSSASGLTDPGRHRSRLPPGRARPVPSVRLPAGSAPPARRGWRQCRPAPRA